jgi:hypothetical protein
MPSQEESLETIAGRLDELAAYLSGLREAARDQAEALRDIARVLVLIEAKIR